MIIYTTGYISVDPVSGFTTDKVISRINGFNLNGGFSTCTVDITFLINSIFSISGIYGSIQVMYYGLAIFTFCPVAGGIIFVGGTIGLISSMYSYCENIETMYRYMKGDESAGTDLVYTAGVNIVSGILSYGLNAAINKFAIPAIKNQLIKRYTDDFVESLVPDAIIYPDGTIESLYNCGKYASDISDIMVNNPGFDILVTEYTEEITDLATQQKINFVSNNANLFLRYGKEAIDICITYGYSGELALNKGGFELIRAYRNDNNISISETANSITIAKPTLPLGSTPSGNYAPETNWGNIQQNKTANLLANNGYDVHMLDEVNPTGNGYGIKSNKNPDFLINDYVFDCYSPTKTSTSKAIIKKMNDKVKNQAERIVLNLSEYEGNINQLKKDILAKTGSNGDLKYLKELIVITPDEKITQWFWRE